MPDPCWVLRLYPSLIYLFSVQHKVVHIVTRVLKVLGSYSEPPAGLADEGLMFTSQV